MWLHVASSEMYKHGRPTVNSPKSLLGYIGLLDQHLLQVYGGPSRDTFLRRHRVPAFHVPRSHVRACGDRVPSPSGRRTWRKELLGSKWWMSSMKLGGSGTKSHSVGATKIEKKQVRVSIITRRVTHWPLITTSSKRPGTKSTRQPLKSSTFTPSFSDDGLREPRLMLPCLNKLLLATRLHGRHPMNPIMNLNPGRSQNCTLAANIQALRGRGQIEIAIVVRVQSPSVCLPTCKAYKAADCSSIYPSNPQSQIDQNQKRKAVVIALKAPGAGSLGRCGACSSSGRIFTKMLWALLIGLKTVHLRSSGPEGVDHKGPRTPTPQPPVQHQNRGGPKQRAQLSWSSGGRASSFCSGNVCVSTLGPRGRQKRPARHVAPEAFGGACDGRQGWKAPVLPILSLQRHLPLPSLHQHPPAQDLPTTQTRTISLMRWISCDIATYDPHVEHHPITPAGWKHLPLTPKNRALPLRLGTSGAGSARRDPSRSPASATQSCPDAPYGLRLLFPPVAQSGYTVGLNLGRCLKSATPISMCKQLPIQFFQCIRLYMKMTHRCSEGSQNPLMPGPSDKLTCELQGTFRS